MIRKTPIVSRREVVAGIGGLAVYAAARPVMAQAPSGTPVRIGQTLSLTGPFAQTGLIHKIVSEYYVEHLNKKAGCSGRPVEYVLYDDQSKPDVSRTLYEKLLTADKVDLVLGALQHGADPRGDGCRGALQQGVHPEHDGRAGARHL